LGYKLTFIKGVDNFPRTQHLETVCSLVKK